ncbi:MAG: cytochrome-c oxidase, cbb3-type subunit III [Hyphomicrobiaceae bacterium]|nr:cytochrome-c oxidase, cbb3-type subunit III [Hyphomicrobiaceae bacterium]
MSNTHEREIDELSGTETTGHVWDGIKELNTPLPRWWLWTFYGTIIWAIGYTIAYPAWPIISGSTPGLLGYSSRGTLDQKLADAKAAQAVFVDQIASMSVDDILANDELARFARAGGSSVFKVYCTQCHGSGAQGGNGYPNLNDDEWIWGGTADQIYTTISHGARFAADPDTHINDMPAFGRDQLLTSEEIDTVAKYVASLSGLEGGVASDEGKTLFEDNCVACHGEGGAGEPDLGGPALNNAIWLYNGSLEGIVAQINQPRQGEMPAWSLRLDDATVKELTVYVHSLGGGQ